MKAPSPRALLGLTEVPSPRGTVGQALLIAGALGVINDFAFFVDGGRASFPFDFASLSEMPDTSPLDVSPELQPLSQLGLTSTMSLRP